MCFYCSVTFSLRTLKVKFKLLQFFDHLSYEDFIVIQSFFNNFKPHAWFWFSFMPFMARRSESCSPKKASDWCRTLFYFEQNFNYSKKLISPVKKIIQQLANPIFHYVNVEIVISLETEVGNEVEARNYRSFSHCKVAEAISFLNFVC